MFSRMLLILCWIVTASVVPNATLKPVFGVQVRFQSGTNMFALVAFLDDGRELTHKKILTTDDFVRIASGYWPSIYNPTRENLFMKNKIPCGMYNDSINLKPFPVCIPVDSLWKLRFSDFPFNTSSERGWSGNLTKPSDKQALYLRDNYHVDNVDMNYFLDTNFWKILRDVQDSSWIANYKALR